MFGWWFGTFFVFPYIGNVIIPTDFHVFQRGRYTTNQNIYIYIYVHILYIYIYRPIMHMLHQGTPHGLESPPLPRPRPKPIALHVNGQVSSCRI